MLSVVEEGAVEVKRSVTFTESKHPYSQILPLVAIF
jgi:hypothetical protein